MEMIFDTLLNKIIEYRTQQRWRDGPKYCTYTGCIFKRDFGPWKNGDVVDKLDIVKEPFVMRGGGKVVHMFLGGITIKD